MPRYVYAWDRINNTWPVRLRVVDGDLGSAGEPTVGAEQAEEALRAAEERYPPPWFAVGSVDASSWEEAADRVRAWHFT